MVCCRQASTLNDALKKKLLSPIKQSETQKTSLQLNYLLKCHCLSQLKQLLAPAVGPASPFKDQIIGDTGACERVNNDQSSFIHTSTEPGSQLELFLTTAEVSLVAKVTLFYS